MGYKARINSKQFKTMERTIIETEFYCAKWNESKGIFTSVWKENTKNMNESDFQENVLISIDAFRQFGDEKANILTDTTKFMYPQTPESIKWGSETVLREMLQNHVERMAVVLPDKIFHSMTISKAVSTINKLGGGELEVRNFGSVREAEKWLMAKPGVLKLA